MKRKEPESLLDELMPIDDLPGMTWYFGILRVVGEIIGEMVETGIGANHFVAPRYRWFFLDLTTYMIALAPISAVAALWFVPRLIALALRKVRRPGYYEQEKAHRQALAHERRSTHRRTTLNPVPTPEALLAQFGRIRRKPREMLLFGSMLEDLEAYVDNDLVRDDDGRIVGRHGGIKQWLRERCPELGKHYHTVMRYKALAKRFKQVIDLEDPVPVAYALAAAETPVEVVVGDSEGRAAEIQPRCGLEFKADGECVVEAVTPERFDLLRGSAAVAEGGRRLARIMGAGENARAFFAGCQAMVKDLVGCQATKERWKTERIQLRCGPSSAADGGGVVSAGERMTKKNLDERLAMLLDPDRTPTSPPRSLPRSRSQDRGVSVSALA